MKKHIFVSVAMFVVAILTMPSLSLAQGVGVEKTNRGISLGPAADNAIYLELLGNGIVYTINYERLLSQDIGLRVGFGYIGFNSGSVTNTNDNSSSLSVSLMTVPLMLNYFVSSHAGGKTGSSKLELGAGILYFHVGASYGPFSGAGDGLGGTATIGYRYQAYDGGFVFRIGLTPIYILSQFGLSGGVSGGFAF